MILKFMNFTKYLNSIRVRVLRDSKNARFTKFHSNTIEKDSMSS